MTRQIGDFLAVLPKHADALPPPPDLLEVLQRDDAVGVSLREHDVILAHPPLHTTLALALALTLALVLDAISQSPLDIHEDEQFRVGAHAANNPRPVIRVAGSHLVLHAVDLLLVLASVAWDSRAEVDVRAPHLLEPAGRDDGVPERKVRPVDHDGGHVARRERDGRVQALRRDRDAVPLVRADHPVRGLVFVRCLRHGGVWVGLHAEALLRVRHHLVLDFG